MFRSRFNDAFPKSLPNFGPQELERDVTESVPGDRVELFLCAILGLLLNRKQDVKYDTITIPMSAASQLTLLDRDTMAEPWKMLYRATKTSGLKIGKRRALC